MKKVANGFPPIIALDRQARKPLHQQIFESYRTAIVGRNWRPGERIPSTRELAIQLGISRVPVLSAYAQLLAEGYLETRSGSGTFVSGSMVDQLTSCKSNGHAPSVCCGPRPVSRRSSILPAFKMAPWLSGWGAFCVGHLAFEHFPFQVWARLMARHSRRVHISTLHFTDPMGSAEFREAIAGYLKTSRAVNCDPEQIMIVSGSQQALEISARALLDPGDSVWIEEPGYRLARQALLLAGARLVPVPVDLEGLNVVSGMERCCHARSAYVTPSHQFPLGVTMSTQRRLQLLDWAQNHGAWIIEDDYDSEYRYQGMPISSLQGLDRNARVIYIGTFSKTLFPSLRVGYMVIPPDLVEAFVTIRHAMDVYPPHLYQAVLTDFINEGHLSRHIRRTRMVYAERRNALIESIRNEFGPELEVLGTEAGMHVVVIIGEEFRDREISKRAARENLWLWPLSPCYAENNRRQGFILGFGSTVAAEMPKRVRQLRQIIADPTQPRSALHVL
jgi:GntR family transcriptional regulator/MocR family aminotransferase